MADINILDFIFVCLLLIVSCAAFVITNFENCVPAVVMKGFKYGAFAYRGPGGNVLNAIEIPKSYYRHFYLYSTTLNAISLMSMVLVYYFEFGVNEYVRGVMKLLLKRDQPAVSVAAAVIAMSLLTLHCARRLHETYHLQVFAKHSKMNLMHYTPALFHYFGINVAIIGASPLFCGSQNRNSVTWTDSWTENISILCILIFMWASYEQHQSNVILANLRKDKKSGAVVTEDYGIPHGRKFELVTSPHRMCEVILYAVLTLLVPTRTYFCIFVWVLVNQALAAKQADDWYRTTFKTYPKNRKAIFPYLL